jgi:hypothetical protein
MSVGLTNVILTRFPGKKRLGFPVVKAEDGVEPDDSGEPYEYEWSLGSDRAGGAQTPPTHAGIIYLLTKLHPKLSPRLGEVPGVPTPRHEIVLGER